MLRESDTTLVAFSSLQTVLAPPTRLPISQHPSSHELNKQIESPSGPQASSSLHCVSSSFIHDGEWSHRVWKIRNAKKRSECCYGKNKEKLTPGRCFCAPDIIFQVAWPMCGPKPPVEVGSALIRGARQEDGR